MALSRIGFYPTLLYNIIMEKISTREWYSRIDQNVILGAIPFKSMEKKLIEEENVTHVVSLNEDFELRYWVSNAEDWASHGVRFLQLPTVDLVCSPSMEDIKKGVEFIMEGAANDSSVYVHCKAGRTRSATLTACYLTEKLQCTPEQAVDMIREKRNHIFLREDNWETIRTYYKSICKSEPSST